MSGKKYCNIVRDLSSALRLAKRHNALNCGEYIYLLISLQSDAETLYKKRTEICKGGTFIMDENEEVMAERLRDPEKWIVIESGMYEHEPVADCHCYVPEDGAKELPSNRIIQIPRDGDYVFAPEVVSFIAQNPAATACITDLSCERGYSGLAFEAMYEVFREILRKNETRKVKIRYVLGEFFAIKGVISLKQNFIPSPVIFTNITVMKTHEFNNDAPASLTWVLKERNVPCREGQLVTDWFAMAFDMEVICKTLPPPL